LNSLVSITQVDISPDMRHAKVFFSVLGDEAEKAQVLEGLERASGFLRRELARTVDLRRIPELTFYRDESMERAGRVLELLGQLSQEKPPR